MAEANGNELFGIRVRDRVIVGFRYPCDKKPGEGDNVERDGERRVAIGLLAVLGKPSTLQFKWSNQSAADYVAGAIKGAKVVTLSARRVAR